MKSAVLNGGPEHEVARGEGGTFTLTPRGSSDVALGKFQPIVEDVRRAAAAGEIEIVIEQLSLDVGIGLVDKVIVRLRPADGS